DPPVPHVRQMDMSVELLCHDERPHLLPLIATDRGARTSQERQAASAHPPPLLAASPRAPTAERRQRRELTAERVSSGPAPCWAASACQLRPQERSADSAASSRQNAVVQVLPRAGPHPRA